MRSKVRGTTSWLALAAVLTAAPCAGALDGPADGGDAAVAPDGSTPPPPGADGGDAPTEPLADGGDAPTEPLADGGAAPDAALACGNGACEAPESCTDCAVDCGTCEPGPALPGAFVRVVDTGPQATTYGHVPAGALKPWTLGSVIKDGVFPRDADGWMRIRGYQFVGPVKIATANVAFYDCDFAPGGVPTALQNGVLWSSSTMPAGGLLIDHCHIDQGMSGYSMGGVNVYQPIQTTIRYSFIEGAGDGIKANSNCLYEHNFIQISGQGEIVSPGHIDGIQGSREKVNWTARHNTILAGVGRTRPEAGGNMGIWGSAYDAPEGYRYNYGVVAEDNYIDGFNAGVALQCTDPARPCIVRRNTFGTDFRFYPTLRIRTWDEYPHVIVENNNVFDRLLDEATGLTSPAP